MGIPERPAAPLRNIGPAPFPDRDKRPQKTGNPRLMGLALAEEEEEDQVLPLVGPHLFVWDRA
jgi:hypothetical protein